MFAKGKVSQAMIDAVRAVLENTETKPINEAMFPGSPEYDAKFPQPKQSSHDKKKVSTGTVYTKKDDEKKETKNEELIGGQKKLDANKNGKIDADDFKKLKSMKKEEVEELDEISKKTLGSYINKAASDVGTSTRIAKNFEYDKEKSLEKHYSGNKGQSVTGSHKNDAEVNREIQTDFEKKAKSRLGGISNATKRLTKEENVDEAFPTVADAQERAKKEKEGKFEKKTTSTGTMYTKKPEEKKEVQKEGFSSFQKRLIESMYGKKSALPIDEVLSKDAKAADFVKDFIHSDDPKFAGKSKKKRQQMALAAYYAKQRNEEIELDEDEDKPNLRLVKTHTSASGNKVAKVYKDKDYGEYRVKHFTDGKHHTKADYHTDDAEDAHNTAQQHLKEDDVSEALDYSNTTVDTLAGRVKGKADNAHVSGKVKLEDTEEGHEDEKEDKKMIKKMVKKDCLTSEEKEEGAAHEKAERSKKKLKSFSSMKKEMIGKDGMTSESVEELDEAKGSYDLYHPTYSAAVQHAHAHLQKKGLEIHPDDWHHHISAGPKKPAEGQTNSLNIPLHKDGKPTKKHAHIQVYNRGNEHRHAYELNMYHD